MKTARFGERAREIEGMLRRHGITITGVEVTRGQHLRIVATDGKRTTSAVTAHTSRSVRGTWNCVGRIKRQLRGA